MDTPAGVKRLTKSRTDRMLDGVCGGIAEYFQLDPTLVRIAWVLLTLFGGSGIILYLVAMIIMPAGPALPGGQPQARPGAGNTRFWGILLIVAGSVWLLGNLGLPLWHRWWDFSWDVVLAVLLILAGVAFMFGGRNYVSTSATAQTGGPQESGPAPASPEAAADIPPPVRRLYRSRIDKKLFGVCGGLGNYFSIDPTIVRLVFVIAAFASFGAAALVYLAMAVLVPQEILIPKTS